MDRYRGRVALVTGASSGIGVAIMQALLRQGLIVVGLARRVHKIQALELKDAPGKLHALKGDVSSEESIQSSFKWIRDNLGGVDILINNAGAGLDGTPTTGKTDAWRLTYDVHVLGLSICTREAVQDMLSRGVDDGFIIHMNSVDSHMPISDAASAIYGSAFCAIKALLEGLRRDLTARKSHIRVGQICPAVVNTEVFNTLESFTPEMMLSQPHLEPEDVAEAVVFMLSQHPRVMVYDIFLRPVGSLY